MKDLANAKIAMMSLYPTPQICRNEFLDGRRVAFAAKSHLVHSRSSFASLFVGCSSTMYRVTDLPHSKSSSRAVIVNCM